MVNVQRSTARSARRWLMGGVLAAVLTACASKPISSAFTLTPGIPQNASTFAIAPTTDAASKAAVRHVEQQLIRLGYRLDASPDLIVLVSAAQHGRDVGALAAGSCDGTEWAEQPGRKWFVGGGRVASLQVHLVDARSGKPVYQSSASIRSRMGSIEGYAKTLAVAALLSDPRRAPDCRPAG